MISILDGRFNSPLNDELENADDLIVVKVWGRMSWQLKLVLWKDRDPIETRFVGNVNVPDFWRNN